MEQLLTENDIKEAARLMTEILSVHQIDKIENRSMSLKSIQAAFSYKNHQMQKFCEWKAIEDWQPYNSGTYINFLAEEKSFSELFEIFIKETSK